MLSKLTRLARIAELALTRKHSPVVWNDVTRAGPVSRQFGLQRGRSVSRYYVDSFVGANKHMIRGRALEVGEIKYLAMYGSDVISRKVLVPSAEALSHRDNLQAAVIADLERPENISSESFDTFVCTQTLPFIYDVRSAIVSSHKLLAAGGVLLGTVSGIAQISRFDMDRWGDYWRFTAASVIRLLTEAFGSNVQVTSMGNALAGTMLLQGIAVEDLPNQSLLEQHDEDYPVIVGFVARKGTD